MDAQNFNYTELGEGLNDVFDDLGGHIFGPEDHRLLKRPIAVSAPQISTAIETCS